MDESGDRISMRLEAVRSFQTQKEKSLDLVSLFLCAIVSFVFSFASNANETLIHAYNQTQAKGLSL
jgi:hypothetical protein